MMTQTELSKSLNPGDEITTTLGRGVVVGAVHVDSKNPQNWWIEPQGADDYDWWIPVLNVVQVNGRPVSMTNSGSKLGMRIKVVDGDLLDQDVEVIVNAWNRNIIPWWLLIPQGVSRAIKKQAGYGPFRELAKKGPIPLGGAVETGAGRLPFKAIIHVAGISMLWRSSERSIRASVQNAIHLASSKGYRSIAFPLIGAGTGGKKEKAVLAIMQDTLRSLVYDGEVRIVRYRRQS